MNESRNHLVCFKCQRNLVDFSKCLYRCLSPLGVRCFLWFLVVPDSELPGEEEWVMAVTSASSLTRLTASGPPRAEAERLPEPANGQVLSLTGFYSVGFLQPRKKGTQLRFKSVVLRGVLRTSVPSQTCVTVSCYLYSSGSNERGEVEGP